MRRETALTLAKIAGYHGDSRTFTRLIIECRVNRQAMNQAWIYGENARQAGVKCHCTDCAPTVQP